MSFICLAVFLLACNLCSADNKFVIGSSEEEILAAIGEPSGKVVSENVVILEYPLCVIKLKDNKVVDLWDNKIIESPAIIPEPDSVKPEQKIPLVKKAIPLTKSSKEKTKKYKKIKSIDNKGRLVDLDSLLVPGKITIIDFYAQWCGPCHIISPKLEELALKYKNVYLRKVDIKNWKTPVVKQFKIRSVPNVRIYDEDGNMAGEPTASYKNIKRYIDNLVK
ncbi:MAG: thioredoxin family protein [Candidatus Omnitrophica bacterium]|nr:thioredoxin family protein [Candidatus Omnitrophota bacterium]